MCLESCFVENIWYCNHRLFVSNLQELSIATAQTLCCEDVVSNLMFCLINFNVLACVFEFLELCLILNSENDLCHSHDELINQQQFLIFINSSDNCSALDHSRCNENYDLEEFWILPNVFAILKLHTFNVSFYIRIN